MELAMISACWLWLEESAVEVPWLPVIERWVMLGLESPLTAFDIALSAACKQRVGGLVWCSWRSVWLCAPDSMGKPPHHLLLLADFSPQVVAHLAMGILQNQWKGRMQ